MNKQAMRFGAVVLTCVLGVMPAITAMAAEPLSASEAEEIAIGAYLVGYPLVTMDISEKVTTNCAQAGSSFGAAINQFSNMNEFPDATFTDVVRPNADTLYSSLMYDVSKEPLVISVPASGGRYWLLQIMDAWTDVYTTPGSRATGNEAQTFAIVPPGWQGTLPEGVKRYDSPTDRGWVLGRVQTNGKADYGNVHAFQKGLKAVPLSASGKDYKAPACVADPSIDMRAPIEQVNGMDGKAFFEHFSEAMKQNPLHANDYPAEDRMARIGIVPGKDFDFNAQPAVVQKAIEDAPSKALPLIEATSEHSGININNWRVNLIGIGTYGADYLSRAAVAYYGLGANKPEDAIYPTADHDVNGKPLDSGEKYVLHFTKDQIPQARAFWSLTMYNDAQTFADNPIDRYTLGDRNKLTYNDDGSLDIWIQRDNPGADKESNWLPTPKSGGFSMTMRIYWPDPAMMTGGWSIPGITPQNAS
ncbi:hypothetical protein EDC90_10308 [Martelella mediterranea]|uniref:DUF1254 domain-containing protein n=2 Tax=Martelella mediterranea TaxID=293089 RepID=A0A4R3NKG4_9HYPH|nr:hypothetical protein EDC90_10308 [Martelella mediterranea]